MYQYTGSGADSADALEELKALNTAVTGKQLETNIRKNSLLVLQSEKSLESKSHSQVVDESKRKVSLLIVPETFVPVWCLQKFVSTLQMAVSSD